MSLEVKIKKKLKEFTLESELNVETGCTGPVSYTHLDVYKRQTYVSMFYKIKESML